jgi:hypothetical protein
MGSSYKFADGLTYLLFPGNLGFGFASYNFPESTAQDDGTAGSISLSFSGSDIPYAGVPNIDWGFGPSGFQTVYTPLAALSGYDYYDWRLDPDKTFPPSAFPKYGTVDRSTPDLRTIFSVSEDPTIESGFSKNVKNQTAFNSISQINVLDLICEGPIEGFITGIYIPNFSGRNAGDIGYTSVTFQPYTTTVGAATPGGPETRSIFWNDVPITDLQGFYNFQFADYKFTYGEKTNDHTIYNPYINLYEERRNYFGRQVDQNKIPLQTSVTRSIGETLYGFYLVSGNQEIITPKTYYIYNTDVSSIKINIKINSLYEQILTGSNAGDVERQDLQMRFSIYRILNNGDVTLLDTSKYAPFERAFWSIDDILIKGKVSQSPVIFTYEINLRPYAENKPSFTLFPNQIGWAIDVTKASREFGTPSLSTSTSVDSITEVYSDRFTYPDAALVCSKFDARYFNEVPTRSYKVRLLKVKIPINYDPISKTYNGPWNGKFKVSWTDNPAWCFYDLITNNRFGLGKYIDSYLADKWNLYEIAQYCDQLVTDGFGGLEPRFRCNVYIASKEEAYKVLNDMASIFQAITYYSAGQITVAQDSPKDPIYLFNNSNVINGDFTYSDASKKSRKTVAIVRYNDENDNYKPAIEYIEDRSSIVKFGIRETDIVAFGCTNKNQARRAGKWLLVTQNTETEVVDFEAGLEGNFLRPGDIILVYDQYRKNQTYAGRTLELTQNHATLDIPYNASNTYAITGVASGFSFDILTPTYNLNQGTQLGDLYVTGFSDVTSSGVSGINSSFTRRGQIQSINITNPGLYITSGSGIYSSNIRMLFPTPLSNSGYSLPQNTVWTIDINTSGYSNIGIDTKSLINNPSNTLYPGYYLESYLNKPKEYRVLNITEKTPEIFNVNALEYNRQKFQDIDNIATLVNVPARPAAPITPNLILSGIFRNSNGDFLIDPTDPSAGHYTSNQGGINSIMYNVIPPSSSSNILYYVNVISGSNFTSSITPLSTQKDILSVSNLRTGISYFDSNFDGIFEPILPPFFTPLYTGSYFFRVFAENSIGERSAPATGLLILRNQASVFSVEASGINVF